MPNPSEEHPVSSKAPNQDLKDMDVLCTFKIKTEGQNSDDGCLKDQWQYPNQDQHAKHQSVTSSILQISRWGIPVRNLQCPQKPQIRTLRTWMFFAPLKSRFRAKICNIDVSKTNEDLKDLDVLYKFKMKVEPKFRILQYQRPVTIKIKIILESPHSEHWFMKNNWTWF